MSSANNRWATNGLGVIEALRATASEGPDRDTHERKALYLIGLATFAGQLTPAYFYNWGILQLMLGHNGQAAAAFNALIPFEADQPAIRYYAAVALLRSGEPDAAARLFAAVAGGPAGEWTAAAAEGHADALAAGGHTQDADAGYAALLAPGGQIDWGIYEKLVRLRLGAAGADRALATVSDLAARFPDEARLQYDRGRLLLLLGRAGAATDALRAAVALRPDDPALHAGLAAALVTTGDARKALPDAEAALRAMNLDPNAADLTLTYSKLDNSSLYQRSVGQAALAANLARQAALAALGQTDRARALAGSVEGQGAGADAAKAGWFRYYAGLLYGAAGFKNEAITRLTPIENVGAAIVVLHNVVPGPGRGALLLARVGLLTPAEVRDQSAALVAAGGGANGQPALPPDAATATAYYENRPQAGAGRGGAPGRALLPRRRRLGDRQGHQRRPAAADRRGRCARRPLPCGRGRLPAPPGAHRPPDRGALRAESLAVAPGLTGAYANRGLLFAQTGQNPAPPPSSARP